MNITPLDILQRRFSKRWRGVDPHEVKDFMELISGEFEELIRESRFLEEELKKLNSVVASFRERENTIKETMITVQKVTQDMKNNVKKEAEIVLAEAKVKADEIISKAHSRAAELASEINSLKKQRIQFESEFQSLIETHLKLLNAGQEEKSEKEALEEKIKYLTKISDS